MPVTDVLNALATSSGVATTLTYATAATKIPSPNCLVVVAIAVGSATATTTMSSSGMTWVLVGRQAGSSVTSELWVGYGSGSNTAPTFINTPSVTCSRIFVIAVFETGVPQASARTTTSVGATGTSTTTDPGSTQSSPVGGLWLESSAINAAVTPTARTGNQAYAYGTYTANSLACSLYYRWGGPDQNAVQMTETITSNNWAVVSGTTTLDQPALSTGNAYKGRDTEYLDQNEEA